MPKIAISYRSEESAAITRLIANTLESDHWEIFWDITDIGPGHDFKARIREEFSRCAVLLVIVGKRWNSEQSGQSRISRDDDPVRMELEIALEQKLSIIPVLVDGATMPDASVLPNTLREFSDLNALPVDARRSFNGDIRNLHHAVVRAIARRKSHTPIPPFWKLTDFSDPPRLIIIAMMSVCFLRAILPSTSMSLPIFVRINGFFDSIIPSATDIYARQWPDYSQDFIYVPIMIIQFLWVSFMYRLDRGFFQRTLQKKYDFSIWVLSRAAAPAGALVGGATVFAAPLCLIPILTGGLILSLVYFLHSRELRGEAKELERYLYTSIWYNMFFTVLLTVLLVLISHAGAILTDVDKVFARILVATFFSIICIGYFLYWRAMKPSLGSEAGWEAKLALWERSTI